MPSTAHVCSTVSINGSPPNACSIASCRSIPPRGTRRPHWRQPLAPISSSDEVKPAVTGGHRRTLNWTE